MSLVSVDELLAQFVKEDAQPKAEAIPNVPDVVFNQNNSWQEVPGPGQVLPGYNNGVIINCDILNDTAFEQFFRMKRSTFAQLHYELNFTSADELLLCLWILGSTNEICDIAVQFNVTLEYVCEVLERNCKYIINLTAKYITWPSLDESKLLEQHFRARFQFPTILGVIGNLHVPTFVPINHPQLLEYINRVTQHPTIVLQAVCDSNYLFRDIFVGYPGNKTTTEILQASPLYKKLKNPKSLIAKMKQHLLGGIDHPQLRTLLTPYPIPIDRKPSKKELCFNNSHACVMETIEGTFRLLGRRFKRLNALNMACPKLTTLSVAAACTLHNYCRIRGDLIY